MWRYHRVKKYYKRCSCGVVAIDGGKDYLKRIGNEEDYEELSIIKNVSCK